eukprot:6401-Heterococcus_DN1.PRE.2
MAATQHKQVNAKAYSTLSGFSCTAYSQSRCHGNIAVLCWQSEYMAAPRCVIILLRYSLCADYTKHCLSATSNA